jgi:hypothetical protein
VQVPDLRHPASFARWRPFRDKVPVRTYCVIRGLDPRIHHSSQQSFEA